jgi:hypothetical protein
MLLKWLLTLLAIIWLYQALRQLFLPQRPSYPSYPPYPPYTPPPAPPPPRPEGEVSGSDGEYIDYEEIK